MKDFQLVYFKILEAKSENKQPTPADLYRLDKYWQMQNELREELNKLGEKQYNLLFKEFVDTYIDVYNTIAIPGQAQFTQIEYKQAQQMINTIWCADNKSWSQRIWYSTSNLQQCLNDCLTECVVAGRRTSDLRKMLQDAFGATYYQADRLVRTEITHIQTQAAQERYRDYGIKEVEVLASGGKKPCAICSKLLNKRFPINGNMPVPAHPNCRCCIVPVIDTKQLNDEKKNGIISQRNTGKSRLIDFQFFAKKSTDYKTVSLPPKEYAHVMSEIATWATKEQLKSKVFNKKIGNYTYIVENNGFGDFRIIGKRRNK